MSLKHNILANYASQIYVAAIGILILPLYIRYMGAEAYGLVGFFTMLQAWFGLLDLGLTPTIARETARYHGGAMSAVVYRRLFRALSLIFAGIAALGGSVLWLLSEVIAARWLNAEELLHDEVVFAVQVMAVSVALRWMGGLYRGVLTGSERLVWLSGFNVLIATLRFAAVLPIMWLFGSTPTIFFIHQFAVALLEIFGLFLMSRRILPAHSRINQAIGWSFRPVQPLLKFALTIAFTSSVWVLVTQTDKLVISGILPLAEYGYFTLAVLVASGVMVISGPISSAIMPRMARLHAEGKNEELVRVYRKATRLVTLTAGSVAITLAACAYPLLYGWTGNVELAAYAAPILQLYAIGNGLLSIGAFPYYLQYAQGDLRYHLVGNMVMVVFLIPCIAYAAATLGGVGAGWVWLGLNALYLFVWVPYVHNKLMPGLNTPWLFRDILTTSMPALAVVASLSFIGIEPDGRFLNLAYTAAIGCAAILFGLLGKCCSRRRLAAKL